MVCKRPAVWARSEYRGMPVPAPPPPPTPPPPPPATHSTTRVLRSQTKSVPRTITPAHAAFIQSANKTKRRKRLDPWYPKRKAPKNPKPRAPPPTHFTCRICISYLPATDFIRWAPPKRRLGKPLDVPQPCIPHLARSPYRPSVDPVCKTCVSSFMAARFDTLGARSVSAGCLEPGCETEWPWEMVMRYFPLDKLEEYNLASFDVWKTDAELLTCPSPGCTSTGLLDPSAPGYPQVQCTSCAFRSCATCLTPWHTDQTCAEVKAAAMHLQMSSDEKQVLALMQSKDGKRCPNCQLVIEKDGGCPSMFCSGCKKHFNWEAAASAVPGTKKALPVVNGTGYWQTPGMVVCEVDRLEGKVPGSEVNRGRIADGNARWLEDFEFEQFLALRPETFGLTHAHLEGVPMPLPDEDDPDL